MNFLNDIGRAFQSADQTINNEVIKPAEATLNPKNTGLINAFDPNKASFNNVFDPNENGFVNSFDPKKNGLKIKGLSEVERGTQNAITQRRTRKANADFHNAFHKSLT